MAHQFVEPVALRGGLQPWKDEAVSPRHPDGQVRHKRCRPGRDRADIALPGGELGQVPPAPGEGSAWQAGRAGCHTRGRVGQYGVVDLRRLRESHEHRRRALEQLHDVDPGDRRRQQAGRREQSGGRIELRLGGEVAAAFERLGEGRQPAASGGHGHKAFADTIPPTITTAEERRQEQP